MARYIDRNELIENLNKFAPEHYTALLNQLITNQPTADVMEVKHGKWIAYKKTMFGSDYKCSLCGNIADEDNRGNFAILTKYCSNCGAKMDGQ